MVVATSLLGFIGKAFSAFSRIDRPRIAWTSVTIAIFALLACAYVSPSPASAAAGINRQINFQGRLLNSQGATVPDGFYNIQFKIYQDGAGTAVGNPGGTLMWTESHLNNNSQGVVVKNGFLSVQLGSINAFASQIDWNQDTIWLSMNIGNTNATCTPFTSCAPDGEMVPMKRMTATPYALNSGLLNGLTSSNFVQLAQGVQTDASSGPSSIFINKTNTGNLLQLQSSGADAFTVSNAGDLTFGAAADHTISIATAAASTAGKTLTMAAGAGGSGTGSTGGELVIQGGAAGGTNGNGGNLTLNAGAKTGTGTAGTISIGTANTSAITLGQNTNVTGTLGVSSNIDTNGSLTVGTADQFVISNAGIVTAGTWQGSAILDTYVADTLTVDSSSSVDWLALTNYPGACAAGSAVSQLGDTITCSAFATGTAANYIQNQFAGAQTSSDFWISGNGRLGGSLTADTSILTATLDTATATALNIGTTGSPTATAINLNQNTTLAAGKSLTVNGDAFTDLTGSGLTIDTGALTVDASSSTGFFRNGGNSFGTSAVLGTNDSNTLAVRTNSVNRATFDTAGTLYLGDSITAASTGTFTIQGSTGAAANAGYNLTLLGGTGGSNSNGGDITLQGGTGTGTGVQGQVRLSVGGYTTTTIGAYGSNSTISQAAVDNYSSIAISASTGGLTITVPAPTTKYDGRVLYIQLTGSNSITLSPSGGSSTSMTPNTVYALVWNTTLNGWLAAGTDSNGFIQNQNSVDQVANFRINGSGQLGGSLTATTSVLTAKLDAASAGALNIGDATTPTATVINLNQNTTLAAGKSLTVTGGNTGSRPAGTEGMVYYDTDTDKLLVFSNGKWQADRTSVTKTVAPSGAAQHIKDSADYVTDGTADEVEINQALSAASGGKVYLFEGTFTTADTISIPNNTTLAGSGKGTLIQFGNLGGVSKNMITNTITGGSGTGVTIRDLKLDGNKTTNSTDTFTGIYLDGMGSSSTNLAGAMITGVLIQNFENHGIHTTNSANNIITGNTIQSNDDHGIYTNTATTGNHDIITNNTITSNTLNGIYLNATVRSVVSGNFIGSNGNYGLRIESGSNNTITSNILRSNTGSGSTSSIHIIGGGGTEAHLIADNNITDTAGTGYAINLSDATVDGVHLSNNTFSGTGASTINDASGGDTIFSGQSNGNSYLIQPVDDFAITGNAASTISTTAGDLTIQGGSGTVTLGTSTNLTASGALTIASAASSALTLTSNAASTWKTTSGNLTIDSAATLNLGTTDATGLSLSKTGSTTTVNGHLTLATGQNLTVNGDVITDLTGSGLTMAGTALTVDASSSTGFFRNGGNSFGTGATLGTNDTNDLTLRTNGTTRATFDQSNNLYLGNGITNASPSNFVVQATGNSGTGAGASLTIQAGSSGASANGANLTLSGGIGSNSVNGLVILSTPTFQNAGSDANCYTGGAAVASDCTIHANSVNNYSSIIVGFSASGKTASLPDPTITTPGRIVYVIGANGSSDFTLSVNGGVFVSNLIALRANASATMVWNGSDWTAAGASSSTTLQAAYDNTLQSAGGAELIVGKTSNTNGLTIRDSSTNPVSGPLISVQSNSAANLFSVNSNVTEYASNPGAESGTGSSFPASTWSALNGNTTATRYTTAGNYIATGQGSVSAASNGTALTGVKNTLTSALATNNHYNVSFSARLTAGHPAFTDMDVYYSIDGSAASVQCKNAIAISESVWTKVNCSFTAPSAGINSSNAIFIRQTGSSSARTFYIDNLSVTIAADFSLTTDGGADNAGSFSTNWNAATAGGAGGTVAQDAADGQTASTSAKLTSNTTTAHSGIRNKLSVNPLVSTLYRVTAYAKATASFTDFKVRYSATGAQTSGGSGYVDCVDYNTQIISTSAWTKVTCYIQTDATTVTTPYLYFVQTAAGTAHNFSVDTASMTLATASTPNVQIGSGSNGGPTTLFTLDKGASAPIAGDNESLLGSMYYDTTLGKLQCYELDGWGACGSSPDNIITISPEYTNAVMHGTGVGTMISDLCSDFLNINDGSSSQPTICSTNETYNFYNWTSPQASSQTYSIYVTYQLPSTFKSFTSGSTSLQGRVSSTSNASVSYGIYKNTGSSMTQCGSNVSVASGAANAWETKVASGAADPSACSFAAGNSIVFKISLSANSNANAYIGNIGFTFSNN